MMHPLQKTLSIFTASLLFSSLVACGGSGGGDDKQDDPLPVSDTPTGPENPDNPAESTSGVFIDSPVVNIGYRTADAVGNITHEGVTSTTGEYEYEPGDTVTFFIGGLEFPAVAASGVVTPLDIAGTTDTSDNSVMNIARLLQTLDTDGDPSNNITISDSAAGSRDPALSPKEFFAQPLADFAASPVVQTLIQNGGQQVPTIELISKEDAQAHLEATLEQQQLGYTNESSITGGWVLDTSVETGNGTEHFIFLAFDEASGHYIHVEEKENPGEIEEGLEWGSYSRDSDKIVKVTGIVDDQNGSIGLYDPADGDFNQEDGEYITFTVAGNSADLDIFETNPDSGASVLVENIPASRVVAYGLQGVWITDPGVTDLADGRLLLLAFLENGTFVEAEDGGTEVGSYSYDSDTGVVSVSDITVDTNTYGLSDFVGTANLKMHVSGNTMTMDIVGEGQITFNRLGAGPVGIPGNSNSTGTGDNPTGDGLLVHEVWKAWWSESQEPYCYETRWVEDTEVVTASDATGAWETVVETVNGEVVTHPEADPDFISAGLGQCPVEYREPYRCADGNFITYEVNSLACEGKEIL